MLDYLSKIPLSCSNVVSNVAGQLAGIDVDANSDPGHLNAPLNPSAARNGNHLAN